MADTTLDTIGDRITSICTAAPFGWTLSPEPQSFRLLPVDALVDGAFRMELESGQPTGLMGLNELRLDRITVEVARLHQGDPVAVAKQLRVDARSLIGAVTRDGYGDGDYHVPDAGRGYTVEQLPGRAFSVLRLTLPVDYEAAI